MTKVAQPTQTAEQFRIRYCTVAEIQRHVLAAKTLSELSSLYWCNAELIECNEPTKKMVIERKEAIIQQLSDERTPTEYEIRYLAQRADTIARLAELWPMIHSFNLGSEQPVDFKPMMEKRRAEISASLDNARFSKHFSNREKAVAEAEQHANNLSWPEDAGEYRRRQDEDAAQEYYERHYDRLAQADNDPGL